MTPTRRAHFYDQIGSGIPKPIVPTGLAPFMTLPAPEARTLKRARLAAAIAEAVAAQGHVTRDELLGRGFTGGDLDELFTEARRIAGVDRMAA